MKTYRRSIRIGNEEIKSPRFSTRADADRWYDAKRKEKLYQKEGLHAPVDKVTTLNDFFHAIWFPKRKVKYPPSTWKADEQRYRDYVAPALGMMKVAKINQLQVRSVLRDVVDKEGQSITTRNRVRALLSKMFNDAMNEDKPLRMDNPAFGIRFDDPRKGKKTPSHMSAERDILKFMKHAKALSRTHFVYACIALMAGPRKSELIPLTYGDVDFETSEIRFHRRFMQAANKIVPGLKSGSDDSRYAPIPDDLVKAIESHRKHTEWNSDDDFIIVREDGKNFGPREISHMHDDICEAAGIKVTVHGLRHTYGRQFALKSGNMKALQAILGHSSSSTTELYSKLAGKGVNNLRNTVSFDIGGDDD